VITKLLKMNWIEFLKDTIYPIILPLMVMIPFLVLIRNYLATEKNLINLLSVIFVGILSTTIATIVYYFISKEFKYHIRKVKEGAFNGN